MVLDIALDGLDRIKYFLQIFKVGNRTGFDFENLNLVIYEATAPYLVSQRFSFKATPFILSKDKNDLDY